MDVFHGDENSANFRQFQKKQVALLEFLSFGMES